MNQIQNKTQRQLLAGGLLLAHMGALFTLSSPVGAQPQEGAPAASTPGPTATPLVGSLPAVPTDETPRPPVEAPSLPPLQVAPPVLTAVPVATAQPQASTTLPKVTLPPVPRKTASANPGRSTQAVGTITGSGTTGNIPKFTGTNAIGNSILVEKSGRIGLGTTSPAGALSVAGGTAPYSIYGSNSGDGAAVYGLHSSASGNTAGVFGETASKSASAAGVRGVVKAAAPGVTSAGVRGINNGTNANGFGVFGSHAGTGAGVYGSSAKGTGVKGTHSDATGVTPGVLGETNSTENYAVGVQGVITPTTPGGYSAGVRGINNGTGGTGIGVYGSHAGYGYGVYGTAPSGYGVIGETTSGYGVRGTSSSGYGVYGQSSTSRGVYGYSSSGIGVYGQGASGDAVVGYSSSGRGLVGTSSTGHGVVGSGFIGIIGSSSASTGGGVAGNGHIGVQGVINVDDANAQGVRGDDGKNGGGKGYAGVFVGRVGVFGNLSVSGTLSKGAGSFKIDHPLHPATEYLSHSFVESPDMMNVYNGNTITNAKGEAWIEMPSYFQALNRDFRYQLTPIGQFAQAIVGKELIGNRFQIKTNKPNVKVSWQVTGIRNDAYAREHRIQVEENKLGDDRGKYLYPAGFGAGDDKRIGPNAPRLAAR